MSRCEADRRDGSPCGGVARPGRPWCFAHDPLLQGKAEEARRSGGQNSSNVARAQKRLPKDMKDVVKTLLGAMGEVHRGELDPKRATAMASLASAAMRVYEVAEVEVRLDALEERAGGGTGGETIAGIVSKYRARE